MAIEVSVVVATRNRPDVLTGLLGSLARQSHPLREVILVDSSDVPVSAERLRRQFRHLNLQLIHTLPSVCAQRNLGILRSTGTHVLLCDDDLELPPHYVSALVDFLERHPSVGAVTGICVHSESETATESEFRPMSVGELLWRFCFQLTVWTDISKIRARGSLSTFVLAGLVRFYRSRGNTHSLAGWPLVTQIGDPWFRAAIFTLGGALVRRQWLVRSPFDPLLDDHGIGDNYGAALGFPGGWPIAVISSLRIVHHRSPLNRLSPALTYFRRILALDYFMTLDHRFKAYHRAFLRWSVFGLLMLHIKRRDREFIRATWRAFAILMIHKNPYVINSRRGGTGPVSPSYERPKKVLDKS